MAYIAKKVCKFSGHNFLKGEVIPEKLVMKSKVPELVKTGVIEVVNQSDGICIPAKTEEGILELNLSVEEIVQVFEVLQSGADEAKAIIDGMTSNDALILLDTTESRKGIRDYVKKRAKSIMKEDESEGISDGEPGENSDSSVENDESDDTSENVE